MSRSIKGSKGCGWEYWTRRYQKFNGSAPTTNGVNLKRLTNRAERRIAKQDEALRG